MVDDASAPSGYRSGVCRSTTAAASGRGLCVFVDGGRVCVCVCVGVCVGVWVWVCVGGGGGVCVSE